ncbi:anhydro-N-acetylmuramic acid kinase [Micromonospora sp. M12]
MASPTSPSSRRTRTCWPSTPDRPTRSSTPPCATSAPASRSTTGRARAAAGQVNPVLLRRLLDEPYYRLPGPKSTGKELFHLPYLLAALADAPTRTRGTCWPRSPG